MYNLINVLNKINLPLSYEWQVKLYHWQGIFLILTTLLLGIVFFWACFNFLYQDPQQATEEDGWDWEGDRFWYEEPEPGKNEYFSVLGLKYGSSKEEIKSAYKQLVKKHHPDAGGNAEMFIKVKNAYEELVKGAA